MPVDRSSLVVNNYEITNFKWTIEEDYKIVKKISKYCVQLHGLIHIDKINKEYQI